MAQKSHFQKMLVYQLFSVVPFGVVKKIRRTWKSVKIQKVVLASDRHEKIGVFLSTYVIGEV